MLKGSKSSLNGDPKEPSASATSSAPGTDRPRKKLSFREPEIMGYYMQKMKREDIGSYKSQKDEGGQKMLSEQSFEGKKVLSNQMSFDKEREKEKILNIQRRISEEDEAEELESQAMRIVRTVGQAFEVCHKLSINSPEPDVDDQDPLDDAEGLEKDIEEFSEKPRKVDTILDPLSCDTLSAPMDDNLSIMDQESSSSPPPTNNQRPLRLDIIAPPPNTTNNSNSNRKPSPLSGETYTSPLLSEQLRSSNEQVPIAGTPLSAHHEIQLLKEQLEQQAQQTQAALAQVHLLRDQLAAETAARLEAQARTHQLLVHNKELLDHITALVSHLQEQERTQQPLQLGGQNVTMVPQLPILGDPLSAMYLADFHDSHHHHHAATTPGTYVTAPNSPKLRHYQQQHSQQPPQQQQQANVFTFSFPTPEQQFQAQLLQRLQGLGAYPSLRSNPYLLSSYQSLPSGLYSMPNYQTTIPMRHRSTTDVRSGPDEPISRDVPTPQFIRPLSKPEPYEDPPPPPVKLEPPPQTPRKQKPPEPKPPEPAVTPKRKMTPAENIPPPASPQPPATSPSKTSTYQNALTSALSSIMRVGDKKHQQHQQQQQQSPNGPPFITRSTSEKVASRSELMGHVQRTAWARQTK